VEQARTTRSYKGGTRGRERAQKSLPELVSKPRSIVEAEVVDGRGSSAATRRTTTRQTGEKLAQLFAEASDGTARAPSLDHRASPARPPRSIDGTSVRFSGVPHH
jgi:hypothetical protein